MKRYVKAVALTLLLALVAAACGGGDTGSDTTESADDGTTTTAAEAETTTTAAMEETTTTAATSGEWEPEYVDGVLQPLPDGFPDREINLFNVFAPGAPDGVYARVMQNAVEDISPVGVTVVDQEQGPMIQFAGMNYVESQPGGTEGYWPIVAAMTGAGLKLLTEPVTPTFGYTDADINPVIATEQVPFILVARSDAPYDTYEELVAHAQANPGEVRYISFIVGSGLDIAMERLMFLDEFTVEKIPLSDLSQVPITVASGEGDVAVVAIGAALAQIDAGNLKPLMIIGTDESPELMADVPTDRDFGYEEPWSSLRGFWVHPDTPDLHREWLYELFRAASEADVYQERIANTPGGTAVTFGREESRDIILSYNSLAEPIVRDLGLHYEDQ